MGREDLLSIKIMDGWHFQENTDCSFECYAHEMKRLLQTRYVGHAIDVLQMMLRYPKKSMPLGTTCSQRELTVVRQRGSIPPPGLNPITIATRWIQRKLAHARAKSTRIPPPGLNPATIAEDVRRLEEIQDMKAEGRCLQEMRERNAASGQGSGGMEAESGASVSGGGCGEIEDCRKELLEAAKDFCQQYESISPPQGNRVMDAEEGFQLEKDTAKRKAPPQGNTAMDAKEGLELNKNTLKQKLVFSCGEQKVPYQHRSAEFRKRVREIPDLLQGGPENLAAGGQLLAGGHGQEGSFLPPRLPAPSPSAQHGLGAVVGQSLGLGHGQDSPTVSGQVVSRPSTADAAPAPDAIPLPFSRAVPPPPSVAGASPAAAAPPPPPPPPPPEKKPRLVLTPNPNAPPQGRPYFEGFH